MYVKLFGTILDSSIWAADAPTRIVWITMLAMANENGVVLASVDGLARRAQVSLKDCQKALRALSRRDYNDRSGVKGGRRIQALQGGWELINYQRYREIKTQKQLEAAARTARWRERQRVTGDTERDTSHTHVTGDRERHTVQKGVTGENVTSVTTEAEAEAEAKAEAEATTTTTTKSKALVAQKRDDIAAELVEVFAKAHHNGALREAKAKLVFAYWAAKWHRGTAVYDAKRRARLEARLKENGDNVSELLWAVDGSRRDDWADRPKYAGIEQLFRDRETVERMVAFAPGVPGTPHPMAVKYVGP